MVLEPKPDLTYRLVKMCKTTRATPQVLASLRHEEFIPIPDDLSSPRERDVVKVSLAGTITWLGVPTDGFCTLFPKVDPLGKIVYQDDMNNYGDIMLMNAGDDEKKRLLDTQFEAQTRHYRKYFANADFLVVLLGNEPVGRLCVYRGADEFRVIDVAILPAFRNRGIGSKLLSDVQNEARLAGKPVRVCVETFGPLNFYERLGFRKVAEVGHHDVMEWSPAPATLVV